MCRENVGIATTRFQSLKDCSGNYVRHLWGTMRVCGDLAGRGQPFLLENSHVISLGQFLISPTNVGIATTRFQSLKDVLGNYVRHLWGTMRVCGVSRPARGLQGLAGLRDRSLRAEGSRVAVSRAGRPRVGLRRRRSGQAAGRAGPASVGTRGLARSREAATPRSASRSRARTAPGRRPASRAR